MSVVTVLDDYQSVALVRRLADSDIVVAMRERTPFRADVLETLAWAGLGLLVVCAIGVYVIHDLTRSLGRVVNAMGE